MLLDLHGIYLLSFVVFTMLPSIQMVVILLLQLVILFKLALLLCYNYNNFQFQVFDAKDGRMINKLNAHKNTVHGVTYSRDGN